MPPALAARPTVESIICFLSGKRQFQDGLVGIDGLGSQTDRDFPVGFKEADRPIVGEYPPLVGGTVAANVETYEAQSGHLHLGTAFVPHHGPDCDYLLA